MFFFFHLLTGIILGFLFADFLRDKRWILPCIIGSILPDLIDKPLGLIIFPSTIGDGRIFTHTLLIAGVMLTLGVYFWKRANDPSVFALGVGLISHQILDLMWLIPSNWYYPFNGNFLGGLPDDYIWKLLSGEVLNSFDLGLAFVLTITFFITLFYHYLIKRQIYIYKNVIRRIITMISLLLCASSGIFIGWGIGRNSIAQLRGIKSEEMIIGGIICALTAILFWRWQERLIKK